ncbi:dephospho-CoA kinase [Fodinibius salinus]|uniref:Dephospho-CoA kinase n=1 Tax=Fodinibius salinus TaxID=860790 RepID=A0A5D3YNF8_9BACT|nr:dephospho-CoA kinase [Fodinibius salinus]TYP95460.1 dephospho-CoA kinase [Fodinibius salinus]
MMTVVGITGGIGSGKSTVCKIWQSLGARLLNADALAKELMNTDPEIKQQLVDKFGTDSFHENGSLNRDHLAKEAFEKNRVEELNAIVHPKIPQAVQYKIQQAQTDGINVFVYEAALLLDNLRPKQMDVVVLVLADRQKRLERVQQRDGSREQEILQRMEKQRNFEESVHEADYVIRNNGTLQELESKAKDLYQNFLP